jgi:hypothetical protein
VITDVARPLDMSPEDIVKRPDVLVIESGEVELPGEVRMKSIGLPDRVAYACLAETIVLALEGRYENFTVGRNLSWPKVKEIYQLGLKHGMKLATISGVNGPYTDEDFDRVRTAALAGPGGTLQPTRWSRHEIGQGQAGPRHRWGDGDGTAVRRARHRRAGRGRRAVGRRRGRAQRHALRTHRGPATAAGSTVEVSGYIVDVADATRSPTPPQPCWTTSTGSTC